MKKMVAIVLLVALIAGLSLSFAEETKPILFRGIEWGSSYDDVAQKLSADGVTIKPLQPMKWANSTEGIMFDDGYDKVFNGECRGTSITYTLGGLQVAGYKVTMLTIEFAYIPGADGLLSRDGKDTAMTYAEYWLDVNDPDAVYRDLIEKLTTLYGKVEETKHDDGWFSSYDQHLWKDKDGAMVSAVFAEIDPKDHRVYIKYSFNRREELLRAAEKACKYEETVNASSNMDGL